MQTKEIGIRAEIPWVAARDPYSLRWVAVCEPLSLTVEVESESELVPVIRESMELLFTDLLESGELDQFLADRGWARRNQLPAHRPRSAQFAFTGWRVSFGEPSDLQAAHS